jgi:hypothetical protein
MQAVAEFIVAVLAIYAALGASFAVPFLIAGIHRVDSHADGSGLGFRLLIFPGVAALWPLLLVRWLRGVSEPPVEVNAHRKKARYGGSP